MELIRARVGEKSNTVIAPIGDFQWAGPGGATAEEHLKRHIDRALKLGAYFVGMGDYIDFLSPSNRARLTSAHLYDTSQKVIIDKARSLTEEVYYRFLEPTKGRWLGVVEGHHFLETGGETSDMWLAEMLGAPFLGTSAFIQVRPCNVVFYVHHGNGGGVLPAASLNKLYHISAGLQGAGVYMTGHSTKMGAVRLSRPRPVWEGAQPDLTHQDVLLVNTGGFAKSNIVRNRFGKIPRGDYAEQGSMTPSPLAAPLIYCGDAHARAEI